MAESNQQLMMNSLKRKSTSNVPGNDFQNKKALITSSTTLSSSSPAFSLIETFLNEEQSKGEFTILNQHFQPQFWLREPLLVQFLELVFKILSLKINGDLLELFLEDIVAFGLELLGIMDDNPPPNISTIIVTSALEVTKVMLHAGDKSGIVKVNPKPTKGIISSMIDYSVKKLVKFLFPDLPQPPSAFLEGGFAPIRKETSPTSVLKVKGEIPANLNGMMIRNGPNPAFDPVANYAWVDGDSMLHAIRFKEGKATYVSRYIQTSRLKQEQFFQDSEFLQYGDLDGKFGLLMSCVQLLRAKLGVLDMSYGWLNAQTGVVYHDGMIMALQDFEKPYVINFSQNGDLETVGINDYKKALTHSVIPHPKKDPITGELFIAGVSYTPPYAIYNYVTKEGVMSCPVPITMSGPSYMHDLGLTKNYVIFMDLPYCYDPENMVNYDDWVYMFAMEKKPRFGILPRYATSEEKIKWFEFDDHFFIFHNGNSWEEDEDTIVLISCSMKPDLPPNHMSEIPKKTKLFFSPAHVHHGPKRRLYSNPTNVGNESSNRQSFTPARVYSGPSIQRIKDFSSSDINDNNKMSSQDTIDSNHEDVKLTLPRIYKFTFNMKTGETSQKELFKTRSDYPKINETYIGRRSQYLYTSEFNDDAKIISIVKSDLQWNIELKLELGANKFGSEVVFVPRQFPSAEDDGYLTTFVHDENNCVSFAYVIDAQKMKISAMIELPNRVPYGFHATFVTEDELQAQKFV